MRDCLIFVGNVDGDSWESRVVVLVCIAALPTRGRLRWKDGVFEGSLGYTLRLCLWREKLDVDIYLCPFGC